MDETLVAKTAKLTAPRTLVFESETLNIGALTGDQVVAETVVSALSVGTELAAYRGLPPLRPGPIYPRLVGYCNVAKVLKVGDKVSLCAPGDLVLTFQSHRSAFVCRETDVLVQVPQGMDLGAAAMTHLFQLGYTALLGGEFKMGQQVAVVGLGVLGMGAVACGVLGGGRVAGFSDQPGALGRIAEFGAWGCFEKSGGQVVADYLKATSQDGADLVLLTSDRWDDWLLALQLARKRGIVSIIGFPGRGQEAPAFNPLDSQYVYDKQLCLQASNHKGEKEVTEDQALRIRRRNCRYLLDMIEAGKLPARSLISGESEWSELANVYEQLMVQRGGALSHLLHWKE
jgi:threonine dehydrogenase-like Zn-dependent dehydrogenase